MPWPVHPRLLLAALLVASCSSGSDTRREAELVDVGPARLDFGPRWVGSWNVETLELVNRGRISATLTTADVPEGFVGVSQLVEIGPRERKHLELVFSPGVAAAFGGDVILRSEEREYVVEVAGLGVPPDLRMAEVLDFGEVEVGSSRTLPFEIENAAELEADDVQTDIVVDEQNAYSIERDVRSVASGGRARLQLAFRPRVEGLYVARLQVAPCAKCAVTSVRLLGKGVARPITTHPGYLNFGVVSPGSSSDRITRLRNDGSSPVTFELAIEGEAAFSLPNEPGALELDPGESTDVTVRFAPRELGDLRGELVVRGQLDQIHARVELNGRGGSALLAVEPDPIVFPEGFARRRSEVTARLVNLGEPEETQLLAARVEGPDAAEFQVMAGPLPAAITPSGVELTVAHVGQRVGTATATLILETSSLGQSRVEVPLSAPVIDEPGCRLIWDPRQLRFGLVEVGVVHTREMILLNDGSGPCTLWGLELVPLDSWAEYQIVSGPPDDTTLEPGESARIRVSFFATAPTPEVSRASIHLWGRYYDWRASGFADDIGLELDPRPLDFGSAAPGEVAVRSAALVNRSGATHYVRRVRVARSDFVLPAEPPALHGDDASFGVRLAAQLPFELRSNARLDLEGTFAPRLSGPLYAWLELWIGEYPEPMLVDMAGVGVWGPCAVCEPLWPTCPDDVVLVLPGSVARSAGPSAPPGTRVDCTWDVVSHPLVSRVAAPAPGCASWFTPDVSGAYGLLLTATAEDGSIGHCISWVHAQPPPGVWIELGVDWSPLHLGAVSLDAGADPEVFAHWSDPRYVVEPTSSGFTLPLGPSTFWSAEAPQRIQIGAFGGADAVSGRNRVDVRVYCMGLVAEHGRQQILLEGEPTGQGVRSLGTVVAGGDRECLYVKDDGHLVAP